MIIIHFNSILYFITFYNKNKDIELYLKSNGYGTQIGDCPFGQFIQMVIQKKGLRYNIHPTLGDKKPDFITSTHDGKMPCLVHKGESMTDSLAIAEFLEREYPHNSLTRQGAYSYQEVLEKASGFFPALSACIKNKEDSKDESLIAAVESELDKLDEIIRSTPGQYACGLEMTLADLYLLPQLFHAMVTLAHFKDIEFYHVGTEPTRPALENYLARMLDIEEFNDRKAYYNVDQVIYGWTKARG